MMKIKVNDQEEQTFTAKTIRSKDDLESFSSQIRVHFPASCPSRFIDAESQGVKSPTKAYRYTELLAFCLSDFSEDKDVLNSDLFWDFLGLERPSFEPNEDNALPRQVRSVTFQYGEMNNTDTRGANHRENDSRIENYIKSCYPSELRSWDEQRPLRGHCSGLFHEAEYVEHLLAKTVEAAWVLDRAFKRDCPEELLQTQFKSRKPWAVITRAKLLRFQALELSSTEENLSTLKSKLYIQQTPNHKDQQWADHLEKSLAHRIFQLRMEVRNWVWILESQTQNTVDQLLTPLRPLQH